LDPDHGTRPTGSPDAPRPVLGQAARQPVRRELSLSNLGPAASPFDSFLLLQGLETLSLRIERHVADTRRIVGYLAEHPQVTAVHYAGLETSPWHAEAARYLPRGAGAVPAFEIAGGLAAGRAFVEA
jgi:O-acetylhomoserine (thiol)-lyase